VDTAIGKTRTQDSFGITLVKTIAHYTKREGIHQMNEDNVVAFHPKNKLVNFYEIAGEDGNAVWGGEDPHSAVQWLRQSPLNSRLLVSCWEAGEEDARLIIEPIDITKIVFAVMAGSQ